MSAQPSTTGNRTFSLIADPDKAIITVIGGRQVLDPNH